MSVQKPDSLAAAPVAAQAGRAVNSVDPEGEFPLEPGEYFFYLLFQAARQRNLLCDRVLKPAGLNMVLWRSLAIVRRLNQCTMSQLARYSTIERTTLTRTVDQLVAEGLIQRVTPPHDRRVVLLTLTDLGEETFLQSVEKLESLNANLLGDLEPERLRETNRVLQQALRSIAGDEDLAADLLAFGPVED